MERQRGSYERLRPLTQGEQSYNLVMQAAGYRYAIWPEASPIRLGEDTAVVYAPIVYDDVDFDTRDAVFTYTGVTLLTIATGGDGGPTAERTVSRLFNEDEVEWGCIGGIRSWGPSGVGGDDGRIYLFGKVNAGLLLARVDASAIANRDSVRKFQLKPDIELTLTHSVRVLERRCLEQRFTLAKVECYLHLWPLLRRRNVLLAAPPHLPVRLHEHIRR